MNQVLIFLHIPKAGGSTLNKILMTNVERFYNIYTEESRQKFKKMSAKDLNQLDLLSGHIPFGFHQYFSRPVSYITLLRDPVDRIISHYYYIIKTPRHYLYKEIKNKQIGLAEYVKSRLTVELRNLQTRMIAGMSLDIDNQDKVTPGDLKRAKNNIKQFFAVAGITEMFNQSLFLMTKIYKWQNGNIKRENVNKNRPAKEAISPQVINTIKANNRFDLELYQYVKEDLINQINNLPVNDKKELNDFCHS